VSAPNDKVVYNPSFSEHAPSARWAEEANRLHISTDPKATKLLKQFNKEGFHFFVDFLLSRFSGPRTRYEVSVGDCEDSQPGAED